MGALDAIDRATVREHGGDRKSGQIKSNNVTLEETPKSQRGNSDTYARSPAMNRCTRPHIVGSFISSGLMDSMRSVVSGAS